MIKQLLCGCCTNGCMCSIHSVDHKSIVCLPHQQGSGLYVIGLDRWTQNWREARDFQCDHDEELDGTYR